LVAYRNTVLDGQIFEIGDYLPKGMKPDRNFAPANIAGNMRARRQYLLKLDAKKKK
jgi:hypothetical protein